jgi:hypothetical protein
MYYVHVRVHAGNVYGVIAKSVAAKGRIVHATHAYGPYDDLEEAKMVASLHCTWVF